MGRRNVPVAEDAGVAGGGGGPGRAHTVIWQAPTARIMSARDYCEGVAGGGGGSGSAHCDLESMHGASNARAILLRYCNGRALA